MEINSLFSFKEAPSYLQNVYKDCELLIDVGDFKKNDKFYAIGVEVDANKLHFFRKERYLEQVGVAVIEG